MIKKLETYGGLRSKRTLNPVKTNIRVLRQLFTVIADEGYTLTSVASANNISRRTITTWRDGDHSPKLDDFEAIAESLGLEVALIRRK